MMQGSAQKRRRAEQDFQACYESLCATQGSAPVAAVKSGLSQAVLDFNGDPVSFPDWAPVLSALAINKQLCHVGVRSCYLASLGSQGWTCIYIYFFLMQKMLSVWLHVSHDGNLYTSGLVAVKL